MFFCGISGEPPQDPVVSSKSGHVYERRLIQKYITDNGTDPLTGEKLEENDLITVKASTCLRHRSAFILGLNVVERPKYRSSTSSEPFLNPCSAANPPKRMGRARSRDIHNETAIQLHPTGVKLRAIRPGRRHSRRRACNQGTRCCPRVRTFI